MTPGEFVFYYVYLPWSMAIIGIIASVIMFVLGGPELRTIIGGKLDPRANFVFSWVDGGAATIKKYHQFEHGVMEGDKEFLLYATPLSDVQYDTTVSFEAARKMMPGSFSDEVVRGMVEAENLKRGADDARKNGEMPVLNEAAKGQCHFAGKPCWIGHRSIGIAMQPTLVEELQKNRRKVRSSSKQANLYAVGVDTIKDFVSMNFSPKRLFQIWQRRRSKRRLNGLRREKRIREDKGCINGL